MARPDCSHQFIEPLEGRTLLAFAGQMVGYLPDYRASVYSQIDYSALTHLNYFSILPDSSGNVSTTVTTTGKPLSQMQGVITAAHAAGVGVSIVVDPSTPFATIDSSATSINNLANQLETFCKNNSLDGIDLDWEPTSVTSADVTNFGNLITAIHAKTAAHGWTLTAAVQPDVYTIPQSLIPDFDWINLMDYNLEYNDPAPIGDATHDSIMYMNNWATYGVPKNKLVMGVPFYGKSGTSWSDSTDTLYGDILTMYHNATGTYPASNVISVTVNGTTYGFNSVGTMQAKASFVRSNGYGGMMMWDLGQDHFTGSGYDSYSLLPALKTAMTVSSSLAVNSSGTLVINGSQASGATINLSDSGAIEVSTNGVVMNFPDTSVSLIAYSGTSGNDTLNISSGLTKPFYIATGGSGADVINLNGGTLTVSNDLRSGSSSLTMNVATYATLVSGSTEHFNALTVNGSFQMSPSGTNVLDVAGLTLGTSGNLDLSNNTLILDYTGSSPATTLRGWLSSGINGGAWNGASGIVSSAVSGTSGSTLGYGEASTIVGPSGGTFAGQTVDGTALLVRFTYLGDANLDRSVNIADLGLLATNYGGSSKVFSQGDFNYDGAVNIADLGLLATNYGKTLSFGNGKVIVFLPQAFAPQAVNPAKKSNYERVADEVI